MCNSMGAPIKYHSLEASAEVKTKQHFVPFIHNSVTLHSRRTVINELSVLKARKLLAIFFPLEEKWDVDDGVLESFCTEV